MCPTIGNLASCATRALSAFFTLKTRVREFCAICGQNLMSEGTVRQWYKMFTDGRTNIHDEERSGLPSVVSDDLVQNIDQKICERRRFTVSEPSCEFPQISRTVLHEIITIRSGYQKFCVAWILNHSVQVTDDETWISFVNAETKSSQSSG
jgi:hypothetical protein